jgi:hypothetical protein
LSSAATRPSIASSGCVTRKRLRWPCIQYLQQQQQPQSVHKDKRLTGLGNCLTGMCPHQAKVTLRYTTCTGLQLVWQQPWRRCPPCPAAAITHAMQNAQHGLSAQMHTTGDCPLHAQTHALCTVQWVADNTPVRRLQLCWQGPRRRRTPRLPAAASGSLPGRQHR